MALELFAAMEGVMDFNVEDVEMFASDGTTGGGGIISPGSPVWMEGRSHGFGLLVIMGCDGVPSCAQVAQMESTLHIVPFSNTLHLIRLAQAWSPHDPLFLP